MDEFKFNKILFYDLVSQIIDDNLALIGSLSNFISTAFVPHVLLQSLTSFYNCRLSNIRREILCANNFSADFLQISEFIKMNSLS